MSRGPHLRRTLAEAIPVAETRGSVQVVRQARENPYDLVISTADPATFVRVKRAFLINITLKEAEDLYRKEITGLQAIVSTENISRELWLRSRHGTWRFFRVTGDNLVEISRDGGPLSKQGKRK